ncbi:MAG TPA: DUF2786 domain-containing protein [Acidimicrobiales bacterium]|nr:DUF2786 domain-containing protein [Acidimicrobiales bacterium]
MRVTTIEEAMQGMSAILSGGDEHLDHLRALEGADRSVVIDAGARLLAAEAAETLDTKGWPAADVVAAFSKQGFSASSRATLEAVLARSDEVSRRLHSGWHHRFELIFDLVRMLGFLRRLPNLPPTHPPTDVVDDVETRVGGKVRALLAKAESTPFEAEAEACTAKAQELMERYAIDDATIGAGGAKQATPTSMRTIVEAPHVRPKVILLSAVARNNRCRSVWLDEFGFATVFGTASDLWAVDLLYTSLLVQAAVAVQREQERSRSFRHAFLLSFAHRIGQRLREATASAMAAAPQASASTFLPVLAAREDAVEAARNAAFPHRSPLRVAMSNAAGAHAGRAAANKASIAHDGALTRRDRRVEAPRAVGPTTS